MSKAGKTLLSLTAALAVSLGTTFADAQKYKTEAELEGLWGSGATTQYQFTLPSTNLIALSLSQTGATQPEAPLATILWDGGPSGTGNAWQTNANWNPDLTSGTGPGTTDLADFGAAGSATTIGILAKSNTNNGSNNEAVGAIELLSASGARTFGNADNGQALTFTLNGTTVNSVSNVILRNASSSLLTLANGGTGLGNGGMTVALGNTTNNVIQISGTGGITIATAITGTGKNLTLGGSGSGILTFSGTAANTYSGVTTVNAGELDLGKTANVNAIAGGGLSITGGAVKYTGTSTDMIGNASTVTVNGATAVFDLGSNHSDTVATVTVDGGGSITGTGTSTLTSTGSFEMKNGSASAILAGSGIVLNKTTAGTVTLSGANTYTGATNVNAGTLLINGNQSSATGAVTVNNSGTLGGTGTIGGAVTVNAGGRITGATAGTVGTLTLQSTATFAGASGNPATYLVDLTALTSDRLAITGALSLSGSFDQIQFQGTAGAASYTLATYSSITGTFDTVTGLPAGYQLIYGANALTLTAVPEPSTWVAGALALLAIGYTQRRRLPKKLFVRI